jgi:hypothetical protein
MYADNGRHKPKRGRGKGQQRSSSEPLETANLQRNRPVLDRDGEHSYREYGSQNRTSLLVHRADLIQDRASGQNAGGTLGFEGDNGSCGVLPDYDYARPASTRLRRLVNDLISGQPSVSH